MDDDTRARLARARAQALAGHVRPPTPAAVVRRVFAVQAQDATAACQGVLARGDGLTVEDVRRAYEVDRSIARGWFLRGTLQTIPSADVRWVLRLLGPATVAASAGRYAQLGLTPAVRERAAGVLAEAMADGPRTRGELAERLTANGLPTDRQAVFHLVRFAALTGILVHGPVRAGEPTFVLLDDWLPTEASRPGPCGDEAAVELARRYARAFGSLEFPGSPGAEEFADWSGLPLPAARGAVRAASERGRPHDRTVDPGGTSQRDAASEAGSEAPAGPDVRALPAFDTYLLGRRARALAVPPARIADVWPGGGMIRPTVTVDGRCVATWSRRRDGRALVHPFGPLPDGVERALGSVLRGLTPG